MKVIKKGVLTALLVVELVSLVYVPTSKTLAAPANGTTITTSPISLELANKPGSSLTSVLQVRNNSTQAINILVKPELFQALGDNGQARIYPAPPGDPSITWVHFSQSSFIAQPGVWTKTTMTIDLPSTAAYGYYFAILFEPQPVLNILNPATNKVKGANAILVLADAQAPGQTQQLQVASFSSVKSTYEYVPATFNIKVYNSGNIYTAPTGDVYISRTKNGPIIDTLDINSGLGNVLPETSRIFSVNWANGFPDYVDKRVNGQIVLAKNGLPQTRLDWNISKVSDFRYGRYYAHLVLVYNNGIRDIPISSYVSFWVIPWLLILIFLVVALLILFSLFTIIRVIVKKIKRSKTKKSEAPKQKK